LISIDQYTIQVFACEIWSKHKLRTPTKKPGFLRDLWTVTKFFRKKAGF